MILNRLQEAKIEIPDKSWVHKIDNRFAPFVKEEYEERVRDVKKYLNDPEGETLAEYSKGKYTCVITRNGRKLYFRNDLKEYPVPAGNWMGRYENDWESKYGISRWDYSDMSRAEKAEIECKEQVNSWIADEYETLFMKFYFPERHSKWYWDEGGKRSGSKEAHKLFKELVK